MWKAELFAVGSDLVFVARVSISGSTRENAVFLGLVTGAVTESERSLNIVIRRALGSPN